MTDSASLSRNRPPELYGLATADRIYMPDAGNAEVCWPVRLCLHSMVNVLYRLNPIDFFLCGSVKAPACSTSVFTVEILLATCCGCIPTCANHDVFVRARSPIERHLHGCIDTHGFSRGTPVSPALAIQRLSILGSHFMSCPRMRGTYGSQLESPSLRHAHITDFNIATVLENEQLATSMSGTKPYMGQTLQSYEYTCRHQLRIGCLLSQRKATIGPAFSRRCQNIVPRPTSTERSSVHECPIHSSPLLVGYQSLASVHTAQTFGCRRIENCAIIRPPR
ncbi:hypothetical protein PR048_030224 [Dryococelus australis]|uniref:Uncharacterized protein n=1 Tax=Dryococelus australis TaxID=614101 RepID=A0ABQ9G8C9_9NEOP|nr:hypothetical protein PR048_030224 [Dryococelus australis]